MFVISYEEALELQLTSLAQPLDQPVKVLRYAQQLWTEVKAGCSFEGAYEAAKKYFQCPPGNDTVPLIVEKSSGFSLYLSDATMRESSSAFHYKMSPNSRTVELRPTFRSRAISEDFLQHGGQPMPKKGKALFRGRPIAQ